jgi:hypothetical protein
VPVPAVRVAEVAPSLSPAPVSAAGAASPDAALSPSGAVAAMAGARVLPPDEVRRRAGFGVASPSAEPPDASSPALPACAAVSALSALSAEAFADAGARRVPGRGDGFGGEPSAFTVEVRSASSRGRSSAAVGAAPSPLAVDSADVVPWVAGRRLPRPPRRRRRRAGAAAPLPVVCVDSAGRAEDAGRPAFDAVSVLEEEPTGWASVRAGVTVGSLVNWGPFVRGPVPAGRERKLNRRGHTDARSTEPERAVGAAPSDCTRPRDAPRSLDPPSGRRRMGVTVDDRVPLLRSARGPLGGSGPTPGGSGGLPAATRRCSFPRSRGHPALASATDGRRRTARGDRDRRHTFRIQDSKRMPRPR